MNSFGILEELFDCFDCLDDEEFEFVLDRPPKSRRNIQDLYITLL